MPPAVLRLCHDRSARSTTTNSRFGRFETASTPEASHNPQIKLRLSSMPVPRHPTRSHAAPRGDQGSPRRVPHGTGEYPHAQNRLPLSPAHRLVRFSAWAATLSGRGSPSCLGFLGAPLWTGAPRSSSCTPVSCLATPPPNPHPNPLSRSSSHCVDAWSAMTTITTVYLPDGAIGSAVVELFSSAPRKPAAGAKLPCWTRACAHALTPSSPSPWLKCDACMYFAVPGPGPPRPPCLSPPPCTCSALPGAQLGSRCAAMRLDARPKWVGDLLAWPCSQAMAKFGSASENARTVGK